MISLSPQQWQQRQAEHIARAEELTAQHLARRARGQRHPVWDFMFEYYPVAPGKLRRWSPGAGVFLAGAQPTDVPHLKFFTARRPSGADEPGMLLDQGAFVAKRGTTVGYIARLLAATRTNPRHFDCFGLHEWAMVYRQGHHRHPEPLRLGQAGTDAVVEAHQIRCTHFDAFRFFTPAARGRNEFAPERARQPELEQSGCLHATMDLYKWATKLGEIIDGSLWLDTFELACQARLLDMQAAPYDLSDWGVEPVQIETAAGKSEYVRRQRQLAARGEELRLRLLEVIATLELPDERQ